MYERKGAKIQFNERQMRQNIQPGRENFQDWVILAPFAKFEIVMFQTLDPWAE